MRTRNGMPVEDETGNPTLYLVCPTCIQVILVRSPLVWQNTAELHFKTCA
jgi:hypothetical protein